MSGMGGTVLLRCVLVAAALLGSQVSVSGDTLSGQSLVQHLRRGGYVLLMRHASSPTARPDHRIADPDNRTLERQLDAKGRSTATAMGRAIKALHIQVNKVLSSPTYRAVETVRLAGLGQAITFPQLGDGGHSMEKGAVSKQADWLRAKVSESPASGTNTVIVTHMPNIATAFGSLANNLGEGETLVFQPNGKGGEMLVARVRIEDWSAFAP
jgi:phosphohistidine phosphatase SixA